jgi:hypothetical protein
MHGTIRTTACTYLKPSPLQSASFKREELRAIASGISLPVKNVTDTAGHYKFTLVTPDLKMSEGYIFKGHCTFTPEKGHLLLGTDFASRIIKRMQSLGMQIFTEPGEYNIVYVEGCNSDGSLNADEPNEWNDLRIVLRCDRGYPEILDWWKATTEPGYYYTDNPMNPKGCARIAIDKQWKAWSVGYHGRQQYEALVQVADVEVYRDYNRDHKRTGDWVDSGMFGINEHHGWDSAYVDSNSAGCLVGKSVHGHEQFMSIIKSDVRYQQNDSYVFWTAVLDGSKL